MSTDPTPPSELAEATARRFELEAELTSAREELHRLQRDLDIERRIRQQQQRLIDSARLVAQLAGHEAAAKALTAAATPGPADGKSWASRLEALAAHEEVQARTLRPRLAALLGKPGAKK